MIDPKEGEEAEEGEGEFEKDRGENDAGDHAEDLTGEAGKTATQPDSEEDCRNPENGEEAAQDPSGAPFHG